MRMFLSNGMKLRILKTNYVSIVYVQSTIEQKIERERQKNGSHTLVTPWPSYFIFFRKTNNFMFRGGDPCSSKTRRVQSIKIIVL